MEQEPTDDVINTFIRLMREKLDRAGAVAKAAEACAKADDADQAVTIMLDVEQPLYEVNTLLNAASLINRIRKEA